MLSLNHEGFGGSVGPSSASNPGLHNQCSVRMCMWSIVSNFKNAQALHTKLKCLVTNTRSPRLRILRGRLGRLVRSLGRTKLQSRRCAFRVYIRQNTWPALVCHPVLSFCDRVSKLRCAPTEVVHSTLFTTPKVHTLSFCCLVSRLIPKLMVLPDRGSWV